MATGGAYIAIAVLVSGDPPRVFIGALFLGLVFGFLGGLVVGFAAALLLALVSPALRTERDARVAGAGTALVGAMALLYVLPGRFTGLEWRVTGWFLLVCAGIGVGVGRVVVFGAKR